MTRLFLFFFILILSVNLSLAQFGSQIPQVTKYSEKVVDPEYGITMYDKLNFQIGGDSVRNDRKGYACQGWVEDHYESGSVIHKGYYEDGHLRAFRNFYPNGSIERIFKLIDLKRCNMQLFYPDGKIKSDITYYESSPQIWKDYYPNGQIEYIEESTKSMEYIIQRKSYTVEGKPQEIFEMTDAKKKLYSKKEYYENGDIKAEGPIRFIPSAVDYQKDGTWKIYDESGKVTTEQWIKGEQIKQ